MNILGINTGLGASVCLLSNGRVVFAVEEERLARKKLWWLSKKALNMASEIFPLEMQNLTAIGICDFEDQAITMEELLQRYEARFQPKPNPLTLQHVRATVSDYLRRKERRQKDKPDLISLTRNSLPDVDIDSKIFHRVKHHQCHAAAAYYGLATNKDPYLIFT